MFEHITNVGGPRVCCSNGAKLTSGGEGGDNEEDVCVEVPGVTMRKMCVWRYQG